MHALGLPSNAFAHTESKGNWHLQDPDVYVKSDMARFLWNFLAESTSSGAAALLSGKLSALLTG